MSHPGQSLFLIDWYSIRVLFFERQRMDAAQFENVTVRRLMLECQANVWIVWKKRFPMIASEGNGGTSTHLDNFIHPKINFPGHKRIMFRPRISSPITIFQGDESLEFPLSKYGKSQFPEIHFNIHFTLMIIHHWNLDFRLKFWQVEDNWEKTVFYLLVSFTN